MRGMEFILCPRKKRKEKERKVGAYERRLVYKRARVRACVRACVGGHVVQVVAGAACLYAFHDVYAHLLRAAAANHVTRRHLVAPAAATVAILAAASMGVASTTTLMTSQHADDSVYSSGAPLAEAFERADMPWIKYGVCALALATLLPAAILQVGFHHHHCHYAATNTDRSTCINTRPG